MHGFQDQLGVVRLFQNQLGLTEAAPQLALQIKQVSRLTDASFGVPGLPGITIRHVSPWGLFVLSHFERQHKDLDSAGLPIAGFAPRDLPANGHEVSLTEIGQAFSHSANTYKRYKGFKRHSITSVFHQQ
jgi:hypothetical protein